MIEYTGAVFRPPSEARSFILQVTLGCSHNRCTFCRAYTDKPFQTRPWADIKKDIDWMSTADPGVTRVFLADGDAFVLSINRLEQIVDYLDEKFSRLERIGIYVYGRNFRNKTVRDICRLREKKLGIGYLGLESGNEDVLRLVDKGCTAEEMACGMEMLKEAGVATSVIGLLGIGGTERSHEHCTDTAEIVSRMQPDYFSLLTTTVIPGTSLYRMQEAGEFELPGTLELLREIRWILEGCRLEHTVFRTNHASNYLPLQGNLNDERETLLEVIDTAIAGRIPLRPEWMRGL